MISAFVVAALLAQSPEYEQPADATSVAPGLNVLSVDASGMLGLLAGAGSLSWERVVAPHATFSVGLGTPYAQMFFPGGLGGLGGLSGLAGGGLYYFGGPGSFAESTSLLGAVRASVRWYASGGAPAGFFVGPIGSIAATSGRIFYDPSPGDSQPGATQFTTTLEAEAGLTIGYSAVFSFGLVLRLGGGLSATWGRRWSGPTQDAQPLISTAFGLGPTATLSLGWSF